MGRGERYRHFFFYIFFFIIESKLYLLWHYAPEILGNGEKLLFHVTFDNYIADVDTMCCSVSLENLWVWQNSIEIHAVTFLQPKLKNIVTLSHRYCYRLSLHDFKNKYLCKNITLTPKSKQSHNGFLLIINHSCLVLWWKFVF